MAKLNLKDSLGSIMEKASVKAEEIGETVSETAKEGLKIANQKAQDARQEIRKRYYNPLFPDQYFDEDFDRPKIVVIEDEDARKAIDVCEGAIGWLSKEAGFEVLHLYEEFVPPLRAYVLSTTLVCGDLLPKPQSGTSLHQSELLL